MAADLESLLVELMLEANEPAPLQERFLTFLVMEPFIRQFRMAGLKNEDLMEMCRRLDQERSKSD